MPNDIRKSTKEKLIFSINENEKVISDFQALQRRIESIDPMLEKNLSDLKLEINNFYKAANIVLREEWQKEGGPFILSQRLIKIAGDEVPRLEMQENGDVNDVSYNQAMDSKIARKIITHIYSSYYGVMKALEQKKIKENNWIILAEI